MCNIIVSTKIYICDHQEESKIAYPCDEDHEEPWPINYLGSARVPRKCSACQQLPGGKSIPKRTGVEWRDMTHAWKQGEGEDKKNEEKDESK